MKKDLIRDYATGAFVRYVSLGCPTRAEYEARIRQEVYERLATREPKVILMRADAAVSARKPILEDLEAVERMFSMLEENGKEDISRAVRAVYMPPAAARPTRREIADRVRAFAVSVPIDERSVYRRLKYARELFAMLRGLTIE